MGLSKDGLTYTFHLRPGIKFSDGSPITAEDVVWNLEQFANPKVNISLPSLGEGIKKISAPDKSTVVIELEHPVAAFLYNIAVFPAFILPKAKVEAEGEAFWKHPVSQRPVHDEGIRLAARTSPSKRTRTTSKRASPT